MQKKEFEELLDQVAGALMLADPDDATSWEELVPLCANVRQFLAANAMPGCVAVVDQVLAALSAGGSSDAAVAGSLLQWTEQVVDLLQQVAQGRISDAEAASAPVASGAHGQGAEPSLPYVEGDELSPLEEHEPPAQETMPLPDETSPAVSRPKDALAAINHELLQREELAGRYLSFFLDQEEYGIEIVRVQEIIRMTEITRIPRAPDFIRGLINLRGQVVAVIDLRARFGLPFIEPTEHTCIIVVNIELKTGHAAMGLVVDAVSEVLQIGADQIESADTLSANLDSHYLLGMAIVAEKVIILLDVDSVLAIVDGIGGEAAGGAV